MIYTIDETISYNSDDCTLSHIPTQEAINLSISAARLFEFLLNSDGEVLSRETLLTEVWDKYGLRGSNSNLNQYLSIVRRALAGYGCDNLIITIPKIGLRLNTDIPIRRTGSPETVAGSQTLSTAGEPAEEQPAPPEVILEKKPAGQPGWLMLNLVLLAMLIASGLYYWLRSDQAGELSPVAVQLQAGCEVVFLNGLDENERQPLEKQILQMLSENQLVCAPDQRIYFDKNTAFTPRNYGRTVLSSCKLNSRGHAISCDNFYYLDWRME